MRYAPCATVDADLMFPNPSDRKGVNDAKKVCGGCEFIEQCLTWALTPEARIRHGVVGGKSEDERRKIKKAPAKPYSVGHIPPKHKRHAPAA
jgi:hypothetical protein